MSRIKNLYTYLITNRRGAVDEWLEAYQAITADIVAVRAELEHGRTTQDPALFQQTRFRGNADPWRDFTKCLLFDKSNGVSSRGQSVLSEENLGRFQQDEAFCSALISLIRTPSKPNFQAFSAAWETALNTHDPEANRTPLLVNRTLAACTLDVTSTVNESYFNVLYEWMVDEGILNRHADPRADWYDKNLQVMAFLRNSFAEELRTGEVSDHLLSIFIWELYDNIYNPFTLKKQVVKYGAPGTGKTYVAIRDTRLLFDIWRDAYGQTTSYTHEGHCEVVQFHPSFGYEDFMEGLRPVLDGEKKAQLTLQNGVFKKFCIRAGRWEKEVFSIPGEGPALAKNWQMLRIRTLRTHRNHLTGDHWEYIFDRHSDDKKVADAVPPFFFIIDEINRAELSRVLGELMLCLEYRGVRGAISTQYSALNTEETGMLKMGDGYRFFIPHNVYVVGTMNTIDRSVESFDLALRRRFRWERMQPDLGALRHHLKEHDTRAGNSAHPWVGLADDLEALNRSIRDTDILGGEYEVGHAYLMNLPYQEALTRTDAREKVWNDGIRPLLEEYLRGSGRKDELIPEFQKAFGVHD